MRKAKDFTRKIIKSLGLLPFYHLALAYLANLYYGHPSREMTVIGVTGTKGKSTVLEMINAVLEMAGKKTVLASSTRFKVGENSSPNLTGNTMPGRGFLQRLLREGARSGCRYALLEVVSEGIVQHRHRFIDFDAAVLVNLHPEHIESHGSFRNYREAKIKFFRDVRNFSKKENKKFFISEGEANASYFVRAVKDGEVVFCPKTNIPLAVAGDFNRENAGLAEAVVRSLGIEEKLIEKALTNFPGVPGRMEFIQKRPFAVVVDYAHTPDSLEAVYKALAGEISNSKAPKKLVCVLGSAGGGRDKWKRPKLGEIAGRYCKEIILTNEDPFDEDPEKIIDEVAAGVQSGKASPPRLYKIIDRGEAIKKAIGLAKPGDAVVITGKGSEPYIRVAGGQRIPWSDKETVIKLFKRRS